MALKHNTFLPNKGQILDKPEEFINEVYSPYSRNMEFSDDFLQGRYGIQKMNTMALSGEILLIDQYWKVNGTWDLMFFTTKDAYKYDFTNGWFDILTPVVTTGSVMFTSTGSGITILGSGTDWNTSLAAGDYFKLGTGNLDTSQDWYLIDSVTNDTGCVLSGTYTGATAAAYQNYTVRDCFAGSNTNFWRCVNYKDASLGETFIATNGVDTPVRYNGSGQVTPLTGLPAGVTSAKYIATFKDRLFLAWVVEGSNEPQRIRWSAVANCTGWSAVDYIDIFDEETWITGLASLSDYLIVFKEDCGYVCRYIGGAYTFDLEKSTSCVGCKAQNSVVETKDNLYYYGADNSFHKWNLLRDVDITPHLTTDIKNFDPDAEEYLYGKEVASKHQIRWVVPQGDVSMNNQVYVYDYEQEILQVWEYMNTAACCSMGEYLNMLDLYVDEAPWATRYVDEWEGYWDAREFLANAPIQLLGGYDKYVYEADMGLDDDGTDYTRLFRTVRMNYKLPDDNKRVWKQQYWFEQNPNDYIKISVKTGDNNQWDTVTKTINSTDTSRDIVKENITWDKRSQNFQYQVESTGHYALLGFITYWMPKRRTLWE